MTKTNALSKADEAYLFIIRESQSNPNFGKTLFWKILYFSDFDFYETHEKSITDSKYRKIENGPAPCIFDRIVSLLKSNGYVIEKRIKIGDKEQIRYFLTKDFNIQSLSQDEMNQIKKNISRLGGMTANQVSAYSHEDMPYKATKMKEIIDYELVFYRNPLFSVINNS